MSESPKPKVFISYSHQDRRWLEALRSMLAPLARTGFQAWWDGEIKPSQKWRDEIDEALASARVAVLLVSRHFLASDFSVDVELHYFINAARQHKVTILWALVAPCLHEHTPLQEIQALHDVARPLSALRGSAREATLKAICQTIAEAAGVEPQAHRPTLSPLQDSAADRQASSDAIRVATRLNPPAPRPELAEPAIPVTSLPPPAPSHSVEVTRNMVIESYDSTEGVAAEPLEGKKFVPRTINGRSPRIRYEDFYIRIASGPTHDYRTSVLESPFGTASSPFKLPFPRRRLLQLLENFAQNRCHSPLTSGASLPEAVGQALFRSLFAGDVEKLFRQSLASMEHQRDRGLRIRLEFDLNNPRLLLVAALPWELLWDARRQDFLSRIRQTPIARYLEIARPPLPPFRGPLRILPVMSTPMNLSALDLTAEWNKVKAQLKADPKIEVGPTRCSELASLREILLAETWHIIHFMGHAGFNRESGEGFLYFEDPAGNAQPVTGRMLAEHLKSFPDLRLVFVNACKGASVPCLAGQDPFAGIATALVLAGIPSVIAMQGAINDAAAIAFSAKFYARLAAGDPVDAAVVEARLAIFREQNFDWATPVLFTRISDGDILGPENGLPM